MAISTPLTLQDLRALRTAPALSPDQAELVGAELAAAMAPCDWFTVGIMAPSCDRAVAALRALEQKLGWAPLVEIATEAEGSAAMGPVFLKGNQNSGSFLARPEDGLGEGILISGQSPANPDAEATWGPLPLDFFA